MKTVRPALLLLAALSPAFANGPAWDSSGNSQLSGNYSFREVIYAGSAGGAISGAATAFGTISFTSGTYTITNQSELVSGNALSPFSATGTYSISATGFGFMTNPLASALSASVNNTLYFLVSNGILVGSATEGGYNTVMIAAPVGSLSTSSLSGAYTISSFFPSGSPAGSYDATYQLNSSGNGTIGNVSITGFTGNDTTLSQNSSGVKYAFSNGAYSITFPTNSNFNTAPFYQGGTSSNTVGENGPLFLYMSPDTDFVFGGTQLGFDIFVGVKNAPTGSTPFSGLYYEAGFDDNEETGLDSFYGSFNAFPLNGAGNIIGHERLLSAGFTPAGETYYDSYPLGIVNTYVNSSSTVNYTVGQDGIRIGYGTNGFLGIGVALPFTPPPANTTVYIDPSGIVNTASSAPYTAGISPGDFITFYNGANLASAQTFAPPGAFPNTLGGVTVTFDGFYQAPIYYVSPTQISVLVPYEVSNFPIATIQVQNSLGTSNTATMYVNETTPGIFTADPEGGIGVAAMLDFPASGASYYIVSENEPAQPGDTVALYLTGLGLPTPSNGDGALGTPGTTVQTIGVDINGTVITSLPYLGLAPGLAGLYQINFQIPPLCTTTVLTGCVTSGDNTMDIGGPDAYTDEAIIPIGTGSSSSVPTGREMPKTPSPAVTRGVPPRLKAVAPHASVESQLSLR